MPKPHEESPTTIPGSDLPAMNMVTGEILGGYSETTWDRDGNLVEYEYDPNDDESYAKFVFEAWQAVKAIPEDEMERCRVNSA